MGGPLAKVCDGDWIELDAVTGTLSIDLSEQELAQRELALPSISADLGVGREFFGVFRRAVGSAEDGASVLYDSAEYANTRAPSQSPSASQEAVA